MIEVVPASVRHIGPISRNMGEMDALECAVFGHTPKRALRLAFGSSYIAFTVLVDGEPEAMFGVRTDSLIEGSGLVWLLMTKKAHRHAVSIVRLGKRYTQALHTQYALLHNHVHADNHAAIRWLTRLGYLVGAVDVINGQPMRPFQRCVTQ